MNTPKHTQARFQSLLLTSALAALTLVTTQVQAAGPPSATTLSAYNITATSADISGKFTANGADTDIYVELSENGAAFQSFYAVTIEGPFVDFVVPITLRPLKPGFPYTYRFRVSNSYGANTSANMQFTTVSTGPDVTTLDAAQVTATSAILQAQIRANGEYTAAVFQWGNGPNDADLTNTFSTGILGPYFDGLASLDLSISPLLQLHPDSGYYYRVPASNSKGQANGNIVYFHTAGPPAVNTLGAQNVGISSVTLRGTVAPRSLGTEYYFQYGTSLSYGATVGSGSMPAAAGTNAVSFNLTGLTPNQAYHYRLVASNSMGRVFGPDSTFTTVAVAPTIVTATPSDISTTTATLRGQVTTGAEGASVWFELGTTTSYGTRGNPQPVPPNNNGTLTGALNGLQRAQTYHYRFVGSNSAGVIYGNDVAFTTSTGNDHCADAFLISSTTFTHTQSTAGMTTAGDDIPSNGCGVGGNDVWFKTTLPASGILTVDTAGSSYDTLLGIFSGACGSLSPIACNDDVAQTALRWSSNRVAVVSGNYYFVVAGWLGSTGTLNFHLSFVPFAAPKVTDLGVDNIRPRTATLHANIEPNYQPTTTWWVLGSTLENATLYPGVLNQGGQPYPVSFPVTGLLPGTTYYYQLNSSNSYGFTEGIAQSFTTPADQSLVEVTVPGDVIVASSANSPAAETAPKAIDNNVTSKYLNFDKLNAGFTVTPSGNKPVRALSLISAEDEPSRDPSSVIVEGSADGLNFIAIASNAVPAFATRHFIQSIPLPGTNQYNVYRLRFPTVANAGLANSMQIAEAELLHHPEITSPGDSVTMLLPGGGVDVRGVHALFDRQLDDTNKLEVASLFGAPVFVDIIPAAGATVLKGFELIGAADDFTYPQRRPSSVAVFGSNDGTNYAVVAGGGAPAAPASNLQIQEFSTEANQTAWARYRVVFGPPVGGDRLQVGEMRLFGERAPVAPALSIRVSGDSILVSWPDAPGFQLETRSALNNGSWTAVGTAPVLSNGINTVTLPKQGTSFFRLRK